MPEDARTSRGERTSSGTREAPNRDEIESRSLNGPAFTEANSAGSVSPRPARQPLSGWLIGVVTGVLIGLWALPPVRYTLSSQLQFALATDGAPWTHPLEPRRTPREIALLDTVAASESSDYLLQVGRATALAGA